MQNIVLLSGKGKFAQFVYNGIMGEFNVAKVILEEGDTYATILKRRVNRIGIVRVAGQYLFSRFVIPRLIKTSRGRIREIAGSYGLNGTKIPDTKKAYVHSVNDPECLQLLQSLEPSVVVVNSTSIIGKKLLSAIACPFINIHSGITPMYRGYAGAYWALAHNDPGNCGSTIHLIDEGIDTGGILQQGTIQISSADNYLTYPFLQLARELELLPKALRDVLGNQVNFIQRNERPGRFFEPTLWAYWFNRIAKRVK